MVWGPPSVRFRDHSWEVYVALEVKLVQSMSFNPCMTAPAPTPRFFLFLAGMGDMWFGYTWQYFGGEPYKVLKIEPRVSYM